MVEKGLRIKKKLWKIIKKINKNYKKIADKTNTNINFFETFCSDISKFYHLHSTYLIWRNSIFIQISYAISRKVPGTFL